MHHSARTAPVVSSTRPRSRIAALPALLLLTVLAALGIAAPSPGPAGPEVAAATAAAAQHRYDETRADDGCDPAGGDVHAPAADAEVSARARVLAVLLVAGGRPCSAPWSSVGCSPSSP
ncbi:hypothetical protein ACFY9S_31635 [Streptomyces sp. NPDC012474]|uniref:hypothetical protein n=1 Tax=Streptomyces sp. NPDC012474 TaxID=3364836 RepID=UPI0036EEDB3E